MEIIKIYGMSETHKNIYDSYLTSDGKYLHLSYLPLENSCREELYDDFFEELNKNQNIYKTVERLYFETDFINRIPETVQKFQNLIELNVSGSRFWN